MPTKKNVISIKGKEYKTAPGRIADFRADHPDYGLVAELITFDENTILYKCTITAPDGFILATAHGSAPRFAQPDANGKYPNWAGKEFEKAETAAMSRALAWLGYGEIDESEAPKTQTNRPLSPTALIKFLQQAAKSSKQIATLISQDEAVTLARRLGEYFQTEKARHEFLMRVFEVESAKELHYTEADALSRWIESADAEIIVKEAQAITGN